MNLSTNDITAFVKKQTIHKRALVEPDVKVQKAAMYSKLLDAVVYAKKLRRLRDTLKNRVCRKYSNSKTRSRRICAEMVEFYHVSKKRDFEAAKTKLNTSSGKT